MGVIPELAGNKEVFSLDNGGDDLLQGSANLILVFVDTSQVEMTVSVPDSDFHLPNDQLNCQIGEAECHIKTDSILDLLRLGQPGSKADLGDWGPV